MVSEKEGSEPKKKTSEGALRGDDMKDDHIIPKINKRKEDALRTKMGKKPRHLPSNRFALELEFVQCLASPAYLHHLATTKVLSDPKFITFLRYLCYWKRPEYARFITFPHCLFFLDLLIESPRFRREMSEVRFRDFVHQQQFLAWQYRARELYGAGRSTENARGIEGGDKNINYATNSGDAPGSA
mmetsp:Transcript_29456/g.67728  ORF Transcript_29456/g.67728 Transcript_29456/m.67728 type:complete len:186 (-) Transcript_29456:108-665(-)